MKTLQSNFTTPKQSNRLLELGVQADSADCYLTRFGIDEDWEVKVLNNVKYCELEISNQDYCLPCWSVGRLMEIYGICMGVEGFFYCKGNFINEAIRRIEGSVKKKLMDFSKLED